MTDAGKPLVLPSFQTLSWTRSSLRSDLAPKPLEEPTTELDVGMGASFPELPIHIVRAAVLEDALSDLLERANDDENVVRVFADSRIESITVCPSGPVRIGLDVEWLLRVIEAEIRTCIKQIIGLHLSLSGGLR